MSNTPRARHEHQIKLNDYTLSGGNTFDAALNRVMSRWRGLDWFTDEQIAEIRAEMIESEWFRHKLKRQNRANAAEAAYLDRQQSLMESGGPDDSAYRRNLIAAGRGHLVRP